jgi:hypothetical protein
MLKGLKINTAVLVCAAFIFKLLFFNVNALAGVNPLHATIASKHLTAKLKKRNEYAEAAVQTTDSKEAVIQQAYDEGIEIEDDSISLEAPIFSTCYFFFNELSDSPNLNILFDFIKCNLYPKKYLALSVLRV